jgi:hypothetical protein
MGKQQGIAMTARTHAHSPSRHRDIRRFRERIQLLLELELFRHAFAEIRGYPDWESNPESLRQLGLVMHRFAPSSKDRSCTYGFARALYRTALNLTQDRFLRAEILADLGAAFLADERLDEAASLFEDSRSLNPWMHRVHLGLLAIACATGDPAAIRRRCKDFIAEVPRWHTNHKAVALLATAPEFEVLRASRRLFRECFGGYPDQLLALHNRHCLEALEPALATFALENAELEHASDPASYPDRLPALHDRHCLEALEPALAAFGRELGDASVATEVVIEIFNTIARPILNSPACTLRDVSVESLQARIGL